ncbi:serine hydrolase domain-containing protein [Vagococcus humatus]|uniref:Serine hydrolase n=1 Tax=Vagococcus humatus TaxID=1889241 RepID=A0A3R9YLA0_9ENTE|nr:serine hydrolase domain-containing protein [Vagococcus humatus]RST90282.1 serine hydrolase [Vagococcus humatus]
MYSQTKKIIDTQLNHNYPGVSYAIFDQQKWCPHFAGYQQLIPTPELVTKHTIFDIASLTKVVCTTTVLLQLLETNDIDLEKSIHFYLPDIKADSVTLRHLLTHTSMIQGFIPNRDSLSQPDLMTALKQLTPSPLIGKQVQYSDTNFIWLGFLLEKLFQQDLFSIFQKQVLDPLEMTHSFFNLPPTSLPLVAATEQHSNRGVIKGEVHDPKAFVLKQHCGSAGLFSSLTDLMLFTNMLLKNGQSPSGKTFLKEKTIQLLTQDHTPSRTLGRSLGWDLLRYENRTFLYHTGYTGTFLLVDPFNQQSFIFLSNALHPTNHRQAYLASRKLLLETYLHEI